MNANDNSKVGQAKASKELQEERSVKEKLEKELARKEKKALAEAVALLVLRKKQMRFVERTARTNAQRHRLQTSSRADVSTQTVPSMVG